MSKVTFLAGRRQITWAYVQRVRGWDDATLALAQAEAAFNGFSPAMYLPLEEYVAVQHESVTMETEDTEPEPSAPILFRIK